MWLVAARRKFAYGELRPHHKSKLTLDNCSDEPANCVITPANIEGALSRVSQTQHITGLGRRRSKAAVSRCGTLRRHAGKKTYVNNSCNPQTICVVTLDAIHRVPILRFWVSRPACRILPIKGQGYWRYNIRAGIMTYLTTPIRSRQHRRNMADAYHPLGYTPSPTRFGRRPRPPLSGSTPDPHRDRFRLV